MARPKKDEKPTDSASLQVSIEDFVRTRDSLEHAVSSVALLTLPYQNVIEIVSSLARELVRGAIDPVQGELTVMPKVVTGLATLQSAVQDLSRAYIAHTNTVIGKSPGSTLELLNLAGPLGGENAIFGNRAVTPAPVAEAGESKKRKRAPHDKNAPKRPVTPYFLYMQTARAEIAKEMPTGHSAKEVADEGTKRWLHMPADEKEEWSYRYNVNFARYKQKVKAYKEGRPLPEISDAEAKKLYDEQLKAGNIKSEAPLDPGPTEITHESESSDDSSSSDEESPEPAKEPSPPKSPPRASKRRKGAAPEKKSSPAKHASPPAAERATASPEVEKKKKGTKKSTKVAEEVEPISTPAATASSPPKSSGQDKAKKSGRKKRKSEAVEE